jgi:hypothetical protein
VLLLDALVERVAVAPESLPGWMGTDTGSVATVTSLGIVGSSTGERDIRGAGLPVDRLAVRPVVAMITSSPPSTRRSSFELEKELRTSSSTFVVTRSPAVSPVTSDCHVGDVSIQLELLRLGLP